MTKPQLRVLAIVLGALIVGVPFLGLDNLPRKLRAEIASEQQTLTTAQKDLQKAQNEVGGYLRAEPELFKVRNLNTALPDRLARASGNLNTASRDVETLAGYAKKNRRTDRERVERLLQDERSLRSKAAAEVSAVGSEARDWIERKDHLPEQVAQMEQDYQTLRSADLVQLAGVVQKAEGDWPEKAEDLENRLAAVSTEPAKAERLWLATADVRHKVAAKDTAGLDYAYLIGAADTLHRDAVEFPERTKELRALSGQLYDSWDKLLIDLEIKKGATPNYQEKVRTVRTHYADAAAKKGDVTSDEKWVEVSKAQYDSVAKNLGMTVEHKAVGKYDSEAERVAQPAGFAYVAPPSQGSNQYGYWEHRGGQTFWTWFPQYLILRDLLSNRYYPPLTPYEYEEYRMERSYGRTYYGRDDAIGSRPKYGSSGTYTERRYSNNTFSRNGGYKDSRYAVQPGGYRGSRYESPASRSGGSTAPRTFGRSGDSRSSGNSGWSSHSSGGSRSSPRSSPSRSGGGRTFGGGGGRRR
jgi:hypothetical protein